MHKQFMQAALEEARLGRGLCAPNPCVGAVVVHNNEIVARACHLGIGTAHAEQIALDSMPKKLTNIVLYVTLEPCNHWGKTPPCVSVIIEKNVDCVVYGYRDPNPVVMINDTTRILYEHGVNVIHFPLKEIDEFYQSYVYWTQFGKPWVTVKLAHTLDGKIAGINGERLELSNQKCGEFTHEQRMYTDVILTTARTIINDNPAMNVRQKLKVQSKPIAVLDRNLSLRSEMRIFKTASICHIYHDANVEVKHPINSCNYHPIPVKNSTFDLSAIIEHLGNLGFHDVWVEAGGTLFRSLHINELVQKTYLYIVPKVLGDDGYSAYNGACWNYFFKRKHHVAWQVKEDNVIATFDWVDH